MGGRHRAVRRRCGLAVPGIVGASGHPGPLSAVSSSACPSCDGILAREFHIEGITGADKTVDVVVDIFNRVNSGGTKLSKGDLALARICAEWGDARPTMRRNLDRWASRDYHFTLDWLLRNANAVATGRAPFSALEDVSAHRFRDALNASLHHIDHFLFDLVAAASASTTTAC